jgi:hypothetical protein
MKRPFFWLILIVFAALFVWWVLYLPYDPKRMYSAIPSNATIVTQHDRLAERWKGLATNTLILKALGTCGVKTNDINEIVEDRVTNDMIGRFASKRTLIAYVPSLGESGPPAWVLASWAGGNSQLLRWGLLSSLLCDFDAVPFRGQKIWTMKPGTNSCGVYLSMAVSEGMLLGCWSPDPRGVGHLVDNLERSQPGGWREVSFKYLLDRARKGGPEPSELQQMIESTPDKACPDRAWVLGLDLGKMIGKSTLRLGVTSFEANSLSGWLRGTVAAPAYTNKPLDTAATQGLAQVLGDVPSAFAILPSEYAELAVSTCPRYVKTIARTLKNEMAENSPIVLALLNPNYSGRLLGVKVPTVVMGVRMKESDRSLDLVVAALDKLNAKYGWAVIPNRIEVDGHPLMVIESTQWGIYNSMKSEERAAFAAMDGWLVFSSNMASLKKLVQAQAARGINDMPVTAWEHGLTTKPATAYAWADLAATSKSAKDVIAMISLVTLVQNTGEDATEQRKALAEAKAIADAVAALKTASLWVNAAGNEMELSFRFGER